MRVVGDSARRDGSHSCGQRAGCLRVIIPGMLAAVALLIATPPCSARPPNIILVVADDLGYGDLGCYGSKTNETPHVDALAGNGLRFTDFHSAGSMCSPTRAAMLTGRYQQRFGRQFDGPLSGERHRNSGLPHQAVTIAELLRENGYATACFGKWHLGYQPPWLPPNQGFDEFRGLGSGDGDHHTHIDRLGNQDWWHNDKIQMEQGYTADLLTRHSIRFIEQNRDRPFFLYVPHLAIHFPWQGPGDPPHRVRGRNYKEDKWGIIPNPSDVSPHVKAMVESVDRSTGDIVATLRRLSLVTKTIILFTSDNGGYLTYGAAFRNISSNGVLRGQKGTLYEGGHRVPMIVSWPGTIQPGTTSETAHSIDLFPTLAAVSEVKRDGRLQLDGVDLSALLLDRQPLPERMLFWRAGDELAVRSGPLKLYVEPGRKELFHLADDLGEKQNLAERFPDVVRRLENAWQQWELDVNQSSRSLIDTARTSE